MVIILYSRHRIWMHLELIIKINDSLFGITLITDRVSISRKGRNASSVSAGIYRLTRKDISPPHSVTYDISLECFVVPRSIANQQYIDVSQKAIFYSAREEYLYVYIYRVFPDPYLIFFLWLFFSLIVNMLFKFGHLFLKYPVYVYI